MEKCYKVVAGIEGKLYSSFVTNQYQLEYKVGEITTPKIGKIFVFKTIEEAASFYDLRCGGEALFLYECECNEVTPQEYRSGEHCGYDYEDFWNDRASVDDLIQSTRKLVYTTDYVKLVREVEWPK